MTLIHAIQIMGGIMTALLAIAAMGWIGQSEGPGEAVVALVLMFVFGALAIWLIGSSF